jgi:hypothetical protein
MATGHGYVQTMVKCGHIYCERICVIRLGKWEYPKSFDYSKKRGFPGDSATEPRASEVIARTYEMQTKILSPTPLKWKANPIAASDRTIR